MPAISACYCGNGSSCLCGVETKAMRAHLDGLGAMEALLEPDQTRHEARVGVDLRARRAHKL